LAHAARPVCHRIARNPVSHVRIAANSSKNFPNPRQNRRSKTNSRQETCMNDMSGDGQPRTTAADVLVETMIDWGIEIVFGLPGDGINGIVEALRKRQDRIRFVVARHEEAAAFMACAYAKWTGRLGCCMATTGPGGVHLLNGLYDAKFDRAPVLALTGLPYHDLVQTSTQQDIDHVRVFHDVSEHSTTITGARQVAQATALACRTALARRGVAHLALPVDVQDQEMEKDEPSPRNKAGASRAFGESRSAPRAEEIERAAEVLNAGKRVAILAGQGAGDAAELLLQTAELLDAPIAKALLGKSILPDDHPCVTGGVGYLGARPSQQVFDACDTLLIVGSAFPYIEYYPEPGKVRAVQIDIDAARLGLRFEREARAQAGARLPRAGSAVEAGVVRGHAGGRRSPGAADEAATRGARSQRPARG
jgi:thiamine pyrophosphate-dependent acetolactate synthase large subunit-like protein